MMKQERRSENLTAGQLADGDSLTLTLIGAQVMVLKGKEMYCGTLQYFFAREVPVYEKITSSKKSGTKTNITFMFEGGARMDFDSTDDNVNIEILYPATAN